MKKLLLLSIVVCLAVGIMAGCTVNQPQVSNTTGQPDGSKTTEKVSQPKTVKMIRGYSVTAERFPAGEDINNNPVIKYHREKSGINIEVENLPAENSSQKIAMILASGDVPDIFEIKSKSLFFSYTMQGAFQPIDDLLNQYAPHYMEIIDDVLFDYVRYDGKIYAVPYCKGDYLYTNGIYARTDIMKKAGISESPKTLEQFKADLITLKEKTGLIPMTASGFNFDSFKNTVGILMGSFGVGTSTIEKDGKLEFSWIQPEYKEFLEYVKSLYDEGLLDPEFVVNQSRQTQERMIGEKAVVSSENWWIAKTIDENLKQKNPESEVKYLPLPTGKDGVSGVQAPKLLNAYFCIPTGAKEPEEAIRFVEYMATDDALFVQNYGIEDLHFTRENGKIVYTAEQSAAVDFLVNYQLVDTRDNFLLRQEKKGFTHYYQQLEGYNKVEEKTNLMPSNDAYDSKISELQTFVLENSVKFIMGTRDLSEFDKYVQEFNQRGGNEAIDAANDWYVNR